MIYLDEAAISKPSKKVLDTVLDVFTNTWYNPNSIYNGGIESKRLWFKSKEVIAEEINCSVDELIICSCGSEAITTALSGFVKANNQFHFLTDKTQHSSVLENPYAIPCIGINKDGFYNIEDISKIHNKLVALSIASSEIGIIQKDLKKIIKILHDNGATVFCDYTAGFGKVKLNVKDLDVDMLVATAQKVHGILGCAFLYIKPEVKIEPLIYGHGIEEMRAGTPNVAALCGFAEAIKEFDWKQVKEMQKMRDYFIYQLLQIPGVRLNGSQESRLCNNINICLSTLNIDNQQLLALLDLQNYCCSASSACNSGIKEPSKTLLALGLSKEDANKSLRLTLSNETSFSDLDKFVVDLNNIVKQFS